MRARPLAVLLALVASLAAVQAGGATSHYRVLADVRLAMDDGVRLAADVYVPTVADADGDGLYPCVVEVTPYRKESRAAEGASYLPEAGIALIEVDARGTGGSEGEYDIVFSVREQADTVAWIEWAATSATEDGAPLGATNKLCETTVGMYGGSYSGIIQYLAASLPLGAGDVGYGRLPAGAPHLAAIAPQRAYGDLYRDIVYHGGMVIGSFGTIWSSGTTAYYTEPPTDVAGYAGQQAWGDHLTRNDPMVIPYLRSPYADATFASDDSPAPGWSQRLYEDSSVLPRIENLRVPTLHLAGFFDAFTRGQLLTFQRAYDLEKSLGGRGPNVLVAGPWNHSGTHFITPDQGYKAHLGAWYRYWLEGKANAAPMPSWLENGWGGGGERVRYFQSVSGTINAQAPADGAWVNATAWPPPAARVEKLFLAVDNQLSAAPSDSASSGYASWVGGPGSGYAETLSRWDNAAGTPQPQWDQRLEQPCPQPAPPAGPRGCDTPKGLTFQSPVLASPIAVAGPIKLRVSVQVLNAPLQGPPTGDPLADSLVPAHNDTDFVAKLSDVGPDGATRLVTQGYLRASHRAVDASRSVTIDGEIMAPHHPHTKAALDPPSPSPLDYRVYDIEIWPAAMTFRAGHRLRLDLGSSDTPNHITILRPTLNTLAMWPIASQSYLALPVVD